MDKQWASGEQAGARKFEFPLLKGQKAIVTGASSGIGQGIAKALGRAGAEVVVAYRSNEEGAQRTVEEIGKSGGRGVPVKADIGKEPDVKALFSRAIKEFGRVDILVNNAGIEKNAPFGEMTLEDWEKVISVNLTGQFLCAREAVNAFRRQGVEEKISCAAGKIIFISSVHEAIPWAGHVNYAAAKGGLALLMKSLAQEVAPERIRVNSIAPGAIRTPINTEAWESEEALKELMALIPYNRIGAPADVGALAVFLASDFADYIVGETIFIDGGMMLYPSFREGG